MNIEDKIKLIFGDDCRVVDRIDDINRIVVKKGEYCYYVSSKVIHARSLLPSMMTNESKLTYFRSMLPEHILPTEFIKEKNKEPRLRIFDKNNNVEYCAVFKHNIDEFIRIYYNSFNIKSQKTHDQLVKQKYGENFFFVRLDESNYNNIIISDGEYEWSVSSNPYQIAGLAIKSMTKSSLIKYWDKKFPNHLSVVDFIRRNGNRYFIVKDIRSGEEFECEYGRSIKDQTNRINRIYNHSLDFFQKSRDKYGDKFSFEKTIYNRADIDIIVTCPIHGDFVTTPHSFLRKKSYGCIKCGIESKHGFTRTSFIRSCKNGTGLLYVIMCYNEQERFIKIGITTHDDLSKRFTCRTVMPYEYETLFSIRTNSEVVFNSERIIHRHFNKHAYKPSLLFNGSTECFDISIKDKAICFIQKLLLNCTGQI